MLGGLPGAVDVPGEEALDSHLFWEWSEEKRPLTRGEDAGLHRDAHLPGGSIQPFWGAS